MLLRLLAFVLVAGLVMPATARKHSTFTCYDGERGVVARSHRVAQVNVYPTCD